MTSNYIVAVSGGVDSVVLLHMFATGRLPHSNSHIPIANLTVAHFDHGIRPDSAGDAEFVKSLADTYGLQYECRREELGAGASEEVARERRYLFLWDLANKHDATIMTAHHADDIVETVAINITRGTGWRGLAVLDSAGIERPLLHMRKQEIIHYAYEHNLEWREDSTNGDTTYLRNKLRQKLNSIDSEAVELVKLYRLRQCALKKIIDAEAMKVTAANGYSRYFMTSIPEVVALELLRTVFVNEKGVSPTIPQRQRALHAIKTAAAGKVFDVAKDMKLRFTKTGFVVE